MKLSINSSLLLKNGKKGIVKGVHGKRAVVLVPILKSVKLISLSSIAEMGTDYDYYQIRNTIPELKKISRIPFKTLSYNSASSDSYISKETLGKALLAFRNFSRILSNIHKLDAKQASRKSNLIMLPFFRMGFKIKGYIEGRNRVVTLVKSGKRYKTYKLPMK